MDRIAAQAPSPPSWTMQLKAIITMSWLNWLLFCIPISWALHFTKQNDTIVFAFSFLAILPLAKLLGFATEELLDHMDAAPMLGGFLNATLGNAIELIVAIIALMKCELHVVRSSLVGTILSNLFLVLGTGLISGGSRFPEQGFDLTSVSINSPLLTIAVVAMLLPSAFHFMAAATTANAAGDPTKVDNWIGLSLGAAVILLLVYSYHPMGRPWARQDEELPEQLAQSANRGNGESPNGPRQFLSHLGRNVTVQPIALADRPNVQRMHVGFAAVNDDGIDDDLEANTTPVANGLNFSLGLTISLIGLLTVLVIETVAFLVDAIGGVVEMFPSISKQWIGLILLPILGNAAEHVTAVSVSVKARLELALGVAVGSSIQIALFVIPLCVVVGWLIGQPFTMLFDPLEFVVLILSVIAVRWRIQDGKLNGIILTCAYVITAVVFWFHTDTTIVADCQPAGSSA